MINTVQMNYASTMCGIIPAQFKDSFASHEMHLGIILRHTQGSVRACPCGNDLWAIIK